MNNQNRNIEMIMNLVEVNYDEDLDDDLIIQEEVRLDDDDDDHEMDRIEDEAEFFLESTFLVRKSKRHQKLKKKQAVKDEKKQAALDRKRNTTTVEKANVDYWAPCELTSCNVCENIAKTPNGGDFHRGDSHPKHKLRCKKFKSCGSVYAHKKDLNIHSDRYKGH